MIGLFVGLLTLAVASPQPPKPAPSPAAQVSPKPAPAPIPVLEGVVKGPKGPVADATVRVRTLESRQLPRMARTDAAGRFSFPAKAGTSYDLRIEAKSLAPAVVLKARAGSPLTIVLSTGVVIDGRVKDAATGAVVPGATVQAEEQAAEGFLPSWDATPPASVRTSSDGRFRIAGLGSGVHRVRASAKGVGAAVLANVRSGKTVDLMLVPRCGASGDVVDAGGRAVPGAIVRAERLDGSGGSEVRSADKRGRFQVDGLEPGDYRVVALHRDHAPALSPAFVLAAQGEHSVRLVLGPAHTVRGRLVAGEKAAPGLVTVQEIAGESTPSFLRGALLAEAGADGRFTLERVPAGRVALAARAAGLLPRRVEVEVDAPTVDAGDITLEPGMTIEGHVRDAAGKPVGGGSVKAYGTGGPLSADVAGDGSYVVTGAPPGRMFLAALADGYATANLQAEAGAKGVDFTLERAGTISGRVVDDEGRGVPAFRLVTTGYERQRTDEERVESGDGRFVMPSIKPGAYALQVSAPDKGTATVGRVEVTAGADTDVGTVRLGQGAVVRGVVSDSGGAPVGGAEVSAIQVDSRVGVGRALVGAVSDEAGRFELRGLPSQPVFVAARHVSYAAVKTGPVDTASPEEVRLQMTRGGRIEGTARTRDGAPLAGALVEVTLAAEGRAPWSMDPVTAAPVAADGTWVLEHVPPGDVRVGLLLRSGNRYAGSQSRDVRVTEGGAVKVDFETRDVRVAGRVARSGEPYAHLRVGFNANGSMMSGSRGPQDVRQDDAVDRLQAVTDASGRYELVVDAPGPYRVSVRSADGRIGYPSRAVEVPDADLAEIDLDLGGIPLQGTVVDRDTGQPVEHATVTARSTAPSRNAGIVESSSDGSFRLEMPGPGEYVVRARARGHASTEVLVKVDAGGAPPLRVVLEPAQRLEGVVFDMRGRPAAAVEVTAAAAGSPTRSDQAQTRPDGSFGFESLGEGTYTIVAGSATSGFAVAPGVASGGAPRSLRLTKAGRLRLRVTGQGQGVYAHMDRIDGRPASHSATQGNTDSSGMVELTLPAGRVEVVVIGPARASVEVLIRPGATTDAAVALSSVK